MGKAQGQTPGLVRWKLGRRRGLQGCRLNNSQTIVKHSNDPINGNSHALFNAKEENLGIEIMHVRSTGHEVDRAIIYW